MKKRILSLALALLMCMTCVSPAAYAQDEKRTIHIKSAEELRKFAQDCILDEYSHDLEVILDCDIDLKGEPFFPIASFSGVFLGGGHSITNFKLATDGSHQGFFRYIQEGASVDSLKISGTVEPGDSRSQTGGIAGTNRGEITNCSFSGTVSALNYVGGIVGENLGTVKNCHVTGTVTGKRFTGGIVGWSCGTVSGCKNDADVNTDITVGGLELNDINLNSVTGINLTSAQDTDVVSDTGGIVGYSSGIVSECRNYGKIGYPHYGYNVGGIAGRQCGYVNACENRGTVNGRKDVAGIVGQMEPYLLLKDTASLAREIQVLQGMINAATQNASAMSAEMADAMRGMGDSIENIYNENLAPNLPDFPEYVPPESTPSAFPPDEQGTETGGEQTAYSFDASEGGGTESGDGESAAPLSVAAHSSESLKLRRSALITRRLSSVGTGTEGGGTESGGTESGGSTSGSLEENKDVFSHEVDNMADVVSWSADVIASDLGGIGNQLAKVMLMMANMLSGATKPVIYEDVSGDEPADSIQGRVNSCANFGRIEGDTNVGGIGGDMGVEYEFDLENELLSRFQSANIISQTFLSKCISSRNVNRGSVLAKKDNVGGVVGQGQVGLITDCENYGSTQSEEGHYVGGIVGLSMTNVTHSYAMCSLDGTGFVGGIAGKCTNISDCASIVELNGVTSCAGAVAGFADVHSEEVTIENNIYVASEKQPMGGIDGISYGGIAEPIDYDELMKLPDLPANFGRLKLSFVADGVEVGTLFFDYGGSIDVSQIPPVPEKVGYNGSWGEHEYTDLRMSEVIEAVYVPRQAALASERTRGESPLSVLLIEGDFPSTAKLSLSESDIPDPVIEGGEVREKWMFTIDGADTSAGYNVHYLEPEHLQRASRIDIYVYDDGQWRELESEKNGSYIVFDAEGGKVIFSAVERKDEKTAEYIAAGGICAVLLLSLVVTLNIRRKKKAKKAAKAAK